MNEKPYTIRLFEFHLEWQHGKEGGIIDYTNIVSVRLKHVKNKYKIKIQSDYQGKITLSNRFYLSNGKFEDRSRQYDTFVRILHLHLNRQSTSSFFTGFSWNELILRASVMIIIDLLAQWTLVWKSDTNQWFLGLNILVFSLVGWLVLKKYPRPYSPENIPLPFLPQLRLYSQRTI